MKQLIILAFLAGVLWSCEKIVAKDITEETPVVLLPTINDTVAINPVHFKWEEMDGASKYHLQVVSKSFTSIDAFVLDSLITGTDFYFPLDSNEYEMQLTAQNGGYESKTVGPIKFWVGTSSGSTGNGNVVLSSPTNQQYENVSFNNQFSWEPFFGATTYEFSLREGSDFATGNIIHSQNNILENGLPSLVYTAPVTLTEGNYIWGVKAYYNGGETSFSFHTLFIDTVAPNDPVLSFPVDGGFENNGLISFSWSNGVDQGTVQSPITSTLEISTDVSFSSPVSYTVIGELIDVDLPTNGTYYWRVTNDDEAGNPSNYSNVHILTVQ